MLSIPLRSFAIEYKHADMLIIRAAQLQALGSLAFVRRVRSFLIERSEDSTFRAWLSRGSESDEHWQRSYAAVGNRDEYSAALYLSFTAACAYRGLDPVSALHQAVSHNDAEFVMKTSLEEWGVIRFSEFDL